MKRKRPTKKEKHDQIVTQIFNGLQDAKTEEDLEAVNDLASDAVTAGILTQKEVDALWDDFAPDIEYLEGGDTNGN